MKEFKIRVKNEAHSVDIQKHLFSKGVYWLDGSDDVKNTYSDYLFVKVVLGMLSLYTADEGEEYFNSFEADEMYFYNREFHADPEALVDWSKAPEWANYAAKDGDGIIFFYEFEPYILDSCDVWTESCGKYRYYEHSLAGGIGWEYSLEERPEEASGDALDESLDEPTKVDTEDKKITSREVIEAPLRGEVVQMSKLKELIDLGKDLGFKVNVYEIERYNGDKTYKADVVVGRFLFLFPDRRYLGVRPTTLYPTDIFQEEFKDKEELFSSLEKAINKHFEDKLNKVRRVSKVKVDSEGLLEI